MADSDAPADRGVVPGRLNIAAEYIDGPIEAGYGERLTYAALQRRVNALAGIGIERGQRVAVLRPDGHRQDPALPASPAGHAFLRELSP